MEREFWHQRWQNNEIGFHRDSVNPYLTAHWQHLSLPQSARVFVPCCGKSLDLLWLREQGHHVIGIEVSPLAVETFFDENGLSADVRTVGRLSVYTIDGLEIYCGDLFDLDTTIVGTIDAVYDRGAMVAMPPGMRADYCGQIRRLGADRASILLVTMEYPQAEMQGPPFSVSADEVRTVYGDDYRIDRRESQDILAREPRFQEKGLTSLMESSYILTPA
jgi:thiopurine S-methyltransferase